MACFPLERPDGLHPLTSPEDVFDAFPEVRLVADATEQSFHRLKGWDNQKPFYSGKKKRHTIKAVACARQRGHRSVGPSVPGSVHDLTLLRRSGDVDALRRRTG